MLILITLIILAVIAFALYISWKNKLITLYVNVDEANAQIATQLQRRYDLIPNLIETVKGYAKHEDSVLEKIANAKSKIGAAQNNLNGTTVGEAEKAFKEARVAVTAVSEAYPELKANTNFQALQEELASTENKVSFARQAMNDAVRQYNTAIQVFPTSLAANGRTPLPMFEVESDEVKAAPKVKF